MSAYKVPNRQFVGSVLLDRVAADVAKQTMDVHKGDDYATMSGDYWTNRRGESVLNINLTGRNGSTFVTSSFPPKTQIKDATYIAGELYKGHDHIMKLDKAPIVGAIVTDNAPVMLAATNKLVDRNNVDAAGVNPHEATLHFTVLGCVLHHYSLLFKSLVALPTIADTIATATKVAVFFKKRANAAGVLEERQMQLYNKTTTPPIPGKTRPGSNQPTLDWFLENKAALRSTVVHSDWTAINWRDRPDIQINHSDVERLMLDSNWWKKLNTALKLLTPLFTMIKAADTDGPEYTAFVYNDMLDFTSHVKGIRDKTSDSEHFQLTVADTAKANNEVRNRWEALHHPIMSVAFVLNPKLGHTRDVLDEREVRDDLKKVFLSMGEDVAECFLMTNKFLDKEGPFAEDHIWSPTAFKVPVCHWWRVWAMETEVKGLRNVALRVLSTTCTSSASERNFSIWGFIHSKTRNRLYNHKLDKLVYVYQNMRILRKMKDPNYQEPYFEVELDSDSDSD